MGEEVEDDLSELARLDAARTKGPWELKEDIDSDVWAGSILLLSDTQYYPTAPGIEDIRFIVAAANAIPSLIAEVRRLRASLTRAEEERDYAAKLDEIIAALTPNERSEMDGYVYAADRMEVCNGLIAKGLLFQWDRLSPLGGAVQHRMNWIASRQPAKQADISREDRPTGPAGTSLPDKPPQ